MKPIAMADKIELLHRALIAIEGLTYLDRELNHNILDEIYNIAHVATGHCKAEHLDWLTKIEQAEECLKKNKICDPEQLLNNFVDKQ
jgi:acetylornithine/succinyldiaminopimelate/putrescine aminotransferase